VQYAAQVALKAVILTNRIEAKIWFGITNVRRNVESGVIHAELNGKTAIQNTHRNSTLRTMGVTVLAAKYPQYLHISARLKFLTKTGYVNPLLLLLYVNKYSIQSTKLKNQLTAK